MGPRLAWLAVLLLGGLTLWVVTETPAAARRRSESSPSGGLRVGFARVDITPDPAKEKVWLAGFSRGRQAQTVHDKLWVRACVLEHGGKKLAFACPDLIGLFDEQVRAAEDRLKAKGFETVVSVTHNHHGPDTLGLWGPGLSTGVDPRYWTQVEEAIVAAVEQAGAKTNPVKANFGSVRAGDLVRDSRQPYVKMEDLTVLRFDAEAGNTTKPAGLFVLWHNHPEFVNSRTTEITSDFVGPVTELLAKEYNCPVFYATGAIGGLMAPISLEVSATESADGKAHKSGSFEALEVYARKIAGRAGQAIAQAEPVQLTPWKLNQRDIYLPVDNMIYRAGHQLGALKRKMHRWGGDISRPGEENNKDLKPAVRTRAGVLTLGEVQVALVPGEIYPELVQGKVPDPAPEGADFPGAVVEPHLLGQLTGKHKLVIGLAQDEIGYILPKRIWDAKAPWSYGRKDPPYGEINSLGPETAGWLLPVYGELAR
jgi:hypothetical protein